MKTVAFLWEKGIKKVLIFRLLGVYLVSHCEFKCWREQKLIY